MPNTIISVSGLCKSFGPITALRDVTLSVQEGQTTAIVGDNGSGKSTLIKLLSGNLAPDAGSITVEGREYPRLSIAQALQMGIRTVYQDLSLDDCKNSYENIFLGHEWMRGPFLDRRRMKREAAALLGRLEITIPDLTEPVRVLSGGQRQRVAIGRAIVRDPQVFLMDEPLSNLDAKLRNQMRAEIIKLRQRINTTFIYVTHDQTEAMTLGDRIVIMKDGLIQQVGNPQQVFNHPANLFVAGFIGSPQMNFFDAELKCKGETYSLVSMDIEMPLHSEIQRRLKMNNVPKGEVTAGIRPEHIVLAGEDDPKALQGKVVVSEMMGSEIHLHITVHENELVVRMPMISMEGESRINFEYGSGVKVACRDDSIHLFNKETGENLIPFDG